MSSQVLSVNDEVGEVERGGGGDGGKTQEGEEVRECAENGVIVAEEDGKEESESEVDGEEEVLYETSSHEQLESSSGSGGSERTWEERFALLQLVLLYELFTTLAQSASYTVI